MKRILTVIAVGVLFAQMAFAGGIVTNTNQSAEWVRMLSRDASTDIDAVYFNPAGVIALGEGLHFSLSNQSIFQEYKLTDDYSTLNDGTYTGDVSAPLFPNLYASFNKEKWAVSAGLGVIGGGGSAEYSRGMPAFELQASGIPSSLTSSGIPTTAYSLDQYFDGSSIFYGVQMNFTYKFSDMISASVGGRVVIANNQYTGYLKNVMINPDMSAHALGASLPMYTGSMVSATDFFTNMSAALTGVANSAYAGATAMNDLVSAAPDLTFAQAEAGIPTFDAAARAQLEGGLLALGIPQAQIDQMTLAQAQGTYQALGEGYTESATGATDNAAATTDKDVDVTQTAIGITPIISVNITPNDKLNIGLKWEGNTTLEFENDTKVDGTGMFPDGTTFNRDMPMMLSAGVQYKVSDNFRAQAGYHLFMDKNADWSGREDLVDDNLYELSIGAEYDINDMFTLSAGYLMGRTGVSESYQDNLSFSLSSNTVGFGAQVNLSEALSVDLGFGKMMYVDMDEHVAADAAAGTAAHITNYDKDGYMFAIGVNYSIF